MIGLIEEKTIDKRDSYSNFALEKVPIHLENSIITGIKIA